MAYRRRQGTTRASTFKEEIHNQTTDDSMPPSSSVLKSSYSFTPSSNSNLADQAIQALHDSDHHRSKSFDAYEDASRSKSGFWGVLARKAKAILEDDVASHYYDMPPPTRSITSQPQFQQPSQSSSDNARKMDNHTLRKGLDALTTSLNHLGDTFDKAFGRSQVAMATAAKANLLLRELKTVKADLAFAKERCTQLEEENKILRENRDKGVNRADDDLIRLQLETLLAEKARLAHENSVYALENRFLREIVEYHQLTIEDVVYLDEGNEEVTEVYPLSSSTGVPSMLSVLSPSTSTSPPSLSEDYALPSKEISPNESHDDQTLKSNQFPSPNKETESKSPSAASSA